MGANRDVNANQEDNSGQAASAELNDVTVREFGFDLEPDQWMNRVRQAFGGVQPALLASPQWVEREPDRPGQQIGAYELVEQIGQGGMGAVWRARRADDQFDRDVAIKLIKTGGCTPELMRRFRLEGQVLASLDHSNIARLFDGGNTSDGRPFLVMEHVQGESILAYSARHGLSVDQRIALMQRVCQGVHAAHANLILHRDLKPSNILVTEDGAPKLLDFGIAKLLDDSGAERTAITETDARVLTPRYASPEQIRGDKLTTATDVYSLGVVLYELLTGRSAYDVDSSSRVEMERAVLDQQPTRASTAVAQRSDLEITERRRLSLRLRGDLDTILAKALQKDIAQRYQSAQELAEDLQRHLDGKSIAAAPDSATVVFRKFVRRNKALTVAAAVCITALIIATVVSLLYASSESRARTEAKQQRVVAEANAQKAIQEAERARKAEHDAEQRANELEQVAAFQASQLSGIETEVMGAHLRNAIIEKRRLALERGARDEQETQAALGQLMRSLVGVNFTDVAVETLDANVFERALAAIDEQFADQPLVRARLLQTVATTLYELGLLDRATDPQEEALRIRRETLGDDHADTLTSIGRMGTLLKAQGKLSEAEPYYREALDGCRLILGDDDQRTLTSMQDMGSLLRAQGKFAEAEFYCREALEGSRRVLGDNHPVTLGSIHGMGFLLQAQGKLAEAEPYWREVLEGRRIVLGDTHSDTLSSINNMGGLLKEQGKLDEAEPYYREAVEGFRSTLGDDHAETLNSIANLGSLLKAQGKLAEAEPYYRQALEGSRRALDDDHPIALLAVNNFCNLLQTQQKLAEAEPYCREVLEGARRVFGDEHPNTLSTMNNMGRLLVAQGKLAEAEPFYREALDGRRRVLGNDHFNTLLSINNMSALLRNLERYEEAEAFGAEAVLRGRSALPAGHWAHAVHLSDHARTLAAMNRFAEAEAELIEAHKTFVGALGENHEHTISTVRALIDLYDAWHTLEPDAGYDARAAEWRDRETPRAAKQPEP